MATTGAIKLEINGIVDQLVRPDGDTFDPDIAKRLKDILVIDCKLTQSKTRPKIAITHTENPEIKIFSLNRNDTISCGNWDLKLSTAEATDPTNNQATEVPCIVIEQKNNLRLTPEKRESYALIYDPEGEPIQLMKGEHKMETLVSFAWLRTRAEALKKNSTSFEKVLKRPAIPEDQDRSTPDPH